MCALPHMRLPLPHGCGRYCLSGASDSIIRFWDLAMQRCVHSYAVHTDSVWALAATPSFTHVYSGGRDGCVSATCSLPWRHHLCRLYSTIGTMLMHNTVTNCALETGAWGGSETRASGSCEGGCYSCSWHGSRTTGGT